MLGNVRVHRLDFVLAISDLSGGFNLKISFYKTGSQVSAKHFYLPFYRAFVCAQFTYRES
jgi:hypothetical protein